VKTMSDCVNRHTDPFPELPADQTKFALTNLLESIMSAAK